LRQQGRKQPAGIREKARTDMDGVAALAQRDLLRP
jgi:hypothetical protein